jgi:hypothetical protein
MLITSLNDMSLHADPLRPPHQLASYKYAGFSSMLLLRRHQPWILDLGSWIFDGINHACVHHLINWTLHVDHLHILRCINLSCSIIVVKRWACNIHNNATDAHSGSATSSLYTYCIITTDARVYDQQHSRWWWIAWWLYCICNRITMLYSSVDECTCMICVWCSYSGS